MGCGQVYGCRQFDQVNLCEQCPSGGEDIEYCRQGIDAKFQEGVCGKCLVKRYKKIQKRMSC